jgi:hypothetical protein
MLRRAWTPAVLSALALGATAYAYVVDRGRISDAERAERAHDVFPSFRVTDVRRVAITLGDDDFGLDRVAATGGRWTVKLPLQPAYRADSGAVDALLRELELAKRVRDVPESEAHGLDAPRVRGRIRVGRIDYEFAIGDDAPRPEGSAYMRVDGEGTFVVDRVLKVQLLRGADAYRERTLVPYGVSEVASLEVTSPATHVTLERAGSTFRLQSATGLRASRAVVDRVFAALADARAEGFLDDAAADRALAPGPCLVRVVPRDARDPALELELGGACPGQSGVVAIAKLGGDRISGCVPASIVDGVQATPDALLDRGLFYAHADEVEAIRIDPAPPVPEARLDLARRGSGWHERAPRDHDLDPDENEAAGGLAEDIAGAAAAEARAAVPGERIVPQARIVVTRTGGGAEEALEIEAPGPDGFALARRGDDHAVLRLSRDVVRRLEARPFVLRGRGIWSPPFDPAAIVSLETTCGAGRERLELRDGAWVLNAPAGFEADRAAADGLAEGLARAKADRWIAERDDGSFGFDAKAACSVAARLAAPSPPSAPSLPAQPAAARSVSLVFGRETDGGYYAKTLDGPGVFVVPPALRTLASRPAIDRQRLRVDPRTVTRVMLLRGTTRVVLERRGERWVREDGDAADAGGGERLADGVLEVAAQAVLHPGPPARGEGFARPTLEIEAFAGSADGVTPSTTDIVVGAPTRVGTSDAYFARVSGVDATFAVARPGVDAILGAW